MTKHLYIVRFTDHADRLDVRKAHTDAHHAYLGANRDKVLVSGPLRFEAGETPIGGLWIMRAESKAEIEAFIDNDPFWKHGLRKSREILHWGKSTDQPVVI